MFVPDQNQLHALYIFRCGELRVGKPNEEMLALLAEDDWAYLSRLKDEAHERGVPIDDLQMIEEDTAEVRQKREAMVPLAMRRVLRLTPVIGSIDALVHVGARGALAIVDVARELPFLEVLDFSNLTSLFLADPYQCEGVTGNDVIEAICCMAATHPSLRVIDLAGQPIGTIAAHHFLELLRRNRRIQEVQFDRDAVDCRLVAYIEREMRHNAALPRVPPVLPRAPSDSIKRLPVHDRETVQEQQLLRRLLETETGLGDIMSLEGISEAVLYARTMSTTEVVTRSSGLRGDGVHLFLLKSGALRAKAGPRGFELRRGDYFGETYGDVLFSPGLLEEAVRGVVYCIPLSHCRFLCDAWAGRVEAYYPLLRQSALLQALDVWMRLRMCCCATQRVFSRGDVVISPGDSFKGIFLVTAGMFGVLGPTAKSPRAQEFTVGDVFGEEAFLARRQCSSVTIVTENFAETNSCLVVEGCAARVLRSHLLPVLTTLASAYSQHEDLMPVRK
ncbi:protein kinase A regulatory subunit [Trypanosoma cruzi]|uniref:Protein kinase A regulatory subunit n=1 Tax=Trypanosoma cruzi TaxID=5693 RepID=A0A2V2VS33_TRYCR|nr:protein kinase A regulatory subunit [Trypanosoma cruzi]